MNRNDKGWTTRWISISVCKSGRVDEFIPEEFGRSSSLVSDDETFLPTSLDFKDLHDGAVTRLDAPENILIDFEGVVRCLFEENGV